MPHTLIVLLLIPLALITTTACNTDLDYDCRNSADCQKDQFCHMGTCTDFDDPPQRELLGPDGASTTADAGLSIDAESTENSEPTDHPCPDASPASPENLLLNEFMANVPQGSEGDANQDGTRHYHDDEFVELVNTSEETVDLTGVEILNDDDVRFTFPATCIDALHAVVVFGGLEEGAPPPSGDGWESHISETWFRYAQGGGRVVVRSADGDTIADVSYGSHPDGSLNLDADLDGADFVAHNDVAPDGSLFSPGTCADGRPFTSRCIEEDDDENDTSQNAKRVPDDD